MIWQLYSYVTWNRSLETTKRGRVSYHSNLYFSPEPYHPSLASLNYSRTTLRIVIYILLSYPIFFINDYKYLEVKRSLGLSCPVASHYQWEYRSLKRISNLLRVTELLSGSTDPWAKVIEVQFQCSFWCSIWREY